MFIITRCRAARTGHDFCVPINFCKKKKKPNTHRRRRRWAQAKRKKKTKQTRRTRCRQGRRLMAVIIGRSGRPIKSETNRWPIRKKKRVHRQSQRIDGGPFNGGHYWRKNFIKSPMNEYLMMRWPSSKKRKKNKKKIKEKKSNGTKKWTVLFRC